MQIKGQKLWTGITKKLASELGVSGLEFRVLIAIAI